MRVLWRAVETITGQSFTRVSIHIDGKRFVDCTFTRCMLGYSGGEVEFKGTILKDCKYLLYGAAREPVFDLQTRRAVNV
ncbi:hypothetical protein AciX9_2001 [Granulicella tundricola MP5ACTX9]|uniref:Uncharacterized protein n=1 Tax=Granulicella tundricola (strain ATCC BAA-1859 / DSM 23138 / MP5ACTX9) TaxID=1198114 RepID=E8X192_GRATM|nr:hypothetical protein AciX9_2001 [Granulicella tundricola MP5ACTX9]